jgi:hypothetical protein
MGYFVDSLFRKDMKAATAASPHAAIGAMVGVAAEQATAASLSEVTRIFMSATPMETLPAEDVRYVGQIVAQRTGLTQQAAEKRVNDTYARVQEKLRDAKATAEKARKASAYAALWLFISLLIGAFVASLAATYGGRRRDI